LTRRLTRDKSGDFWRAWLVRLTALVFVLQSVGLFAAPARPTQVVTLATAQADAPAMEMPDCPHHKKQGHGHEQGKSESCPMCQTLGAALPGIVKRPGERLIGLLAIPAPQLAPRAPPLQSPPPRGPPVLV
jgi:hypothetical protein